MFSIVLITKLPLCVKRLFSVISDHAEVRL